MSQLSARPANVPFPASVSSLVHKVPYAPAIRFCIATVPAAPVMPCD